eukprot:6934565-Prymnesium_polylepis.1
MEAAGRARAVRSGAPRPRGMRAGRGHSVGCDVAQKPLSRVWMADGLWCAVRRYRALRALRGALSHEVRVVEMTNG